MHISCQSCVAARRRSRVSRIGPMTHSTPMGGSTISAWWPEDHLPGMQLNLHHPLRHKRIILEILKGFRLTRRLKNHHGKQITFTCTRAAHKHLPFFIQPLEMCRMFYGKRLPLQRHISQPGRTGPEKSEKIHHARPFSALFGGCDPQDLSTRRLEVEVVVAE